MQLQRRKCRCLLFTAKNKLSGKICEEFMEDSAKELEKYRLRKRRQQTIRNIKENFQRIFISKKMNRVEEMQGTTETVDKQNSDKCIVTESDGEIYYSDIDNHDADALPEKTEPADPHIQHKEKEYRIFTNILRVLGALFWFTVLLITIELGFAIVFVLFSALFGIYFNTRTTPRKPDEPSAYSVFNKNCESIDGTLKAEQFEREIGIVR